MSILLEDKIQPLTGSLTLCRVQGGLFWDHNSELLSLYHFVLSALGPGDTLVAGWDCRNFELGAGFQEAHGVCSRAEESSEVRLL